MNRVSLFLFPLVVSTSLVAAESFAPPAVREIVLEREQVFVFGTPGVATSIEFPEPVIAVKTAYVTQDPKTNPGDWMMHFAEGSRYITVMPLSGAAKMRNLNVITPSGALVVMLESDVVKADALVHLRKVAKKQKVDEKEQEQGGQKIEDARIQEKQDKARRLVPDDGSSGYSVSTTAPKVKRRSADPVRMVSFLDKVKLVALQPREKRGELTKLMPGITYSERREDIVDYESFRFIIRLVVRDDNMDAVALHFTIENRSRYKLFPNAESAWLRCGDMVYRQSLPDIPVEVPAMQSVDGFFIIQGDGQGGRNNLRADNRFVIGMEMGVGDAAPADEVIKSAQQKKEVAK